MGYRVKPEGWLMLIIIIVASITLGIIYGRTSYIPNICQNIRDHYGNEPITYTHPAYSKYLDSNNNQIACD